MKNLIFILALLTISIGVNAQAKTNKEKAKSDTEYVATAMKLDTKQTDYLYNTIFEKYKMTSKKVDKGMSQEEKKAIYKEMYTWTKTELEKEFSKAETKEIFTLIKEKKKKEKK